MKSRWNDLEARQCTGDLPQRIYSSRLLGADPTLVLHGGGNTSVKTPFADLFGEREQALYVKGSGADLATIDASGFAPCRMSHLLRLAQLESLSDMQMAVELRRSLMDPAAPAPSVEAILHAILPAKFVDHTHADAILSVCNTPDGEQRIEEIYGDRVVVIPYVMPGFRLARLCAQLFPARAGARTQGMLLMSHGLFSFGDTARIAYESMIELVTRAEEYLARHHAWTVGLPITSPATSLAEPADTPPAEPGALSGRAQIAALRREVCVAAGAPMILSVRGDEEALDFARRPDVGEISQQGPATPDHVIRTKRLPLLGRDVGAYASAYRDYFARHGSAGLTTLDPAPRVILDAELGLCCVGRTAAEAHIVEDIYRHTMRVIARAVALGGWRALPAAEIFAVEYWDLEQAKLRRGGAPPPFTGEAALVTGAASGIGKACVESLLRRGAAVVGLDLSATVTTLHRRADYLGLQCDLTDEGQVERALEQAARTFGGLDLLILNAGIFPASTPLASLSTRDWRSVMSINLDANLILMRQCHPLLRLAPRGGRVVFIGSKNVPAPGPGAAAYSSSKAALQQLARVAALEWASDHIRVNTLHPNAVFDTAIWTPEVMASRAAAYGMSVEDYRRNNLLHVEVRSSDVAELAAELCGPLFAKTTGAQIPVDGGNERVI
jgi:rhamnose utilization protein RhaD (predicted bifunctional aldolase and dehydrogenase)/NAD(P)-dependent dehydrogenase (short-subunit alcohol dehydrogenase family)